MQERTSHSRAEFTSEFPGTEDIAQHVWTVLRANAVVDDFRIDPNDELLYVFGLADDDLDELVLNLLRDCGCRIPSPAETAGLPPVRTVSDLIGFLSKMRSGHE
jgi:hypothetical protein